MLRLLTLLLAQAQPLEPYRPSPSLPTSSLVAAATPVRSAPHVDGMLSDSVWALAAPLATFTQREPLEGAPATFATRALVVFTEEAMYVGIRADDPEPARILAPLARRDGRPTGDWVGVMIDSHRDRRTAFEFAVNPAGVRRDVYWFNDYEEDVSWDAVWDAAVARDDAGWSAEFRIPFSQLRFARTRDGRVGFNVYREVGRSHEIHYWALPPRSQRGIVSRFGDLVGLDVTERARRLEVSPFVAARMGDNRRMDDGVSAGADLRLAIAGLTLSGAINPDFGQVEADPTTVNLSAQELFFPERRPLFVDGAEFFRFPLSADTMSSETMLYTRRIGRVPQASPDQPLAPGSVLAPATILAAAKLLGRTTGGWSIGVLAALTDEQSAPLAGAEPDQAVVDPRTGFLAARLSRNLNDGRTVAGVFGTLVRRAGADGATLPSRALAGAMTISHRFGDDGYIARALLAGSDVVGSARAIELLQRSPAHYFHRPDIDYASFDPARESLAGTAGWLELARDRGAWVWSGKWSSRSPGFDVNDAGFLSEAGRHSARWTVSRRWLEPGPTFQQSELQVESFWNGEYDWRTTARGLGLRAIGVLRNYTSFRFEAWRALSRVEPLALRGGPAMGRPGNYFFRAEARTDRSRALAVGMSFTTRPFDDGVAQETRIGPSLFWRPSARFDLEFTPELERNAQREQYVGTGRVGDRDEYVLGHLTQRAIALATRVNFAFSPTLTVEAYTRPYASTGAYTGFSRLVDPSSRDTDRRAAPLAAHAVTRTPTSASFDLDADGRADLTVAAPDFTLRSMRSTLVLRWEYRRGSAMSLVLQPEQETTVATADRHPAASLGDLTRGRYGTSVLLKVSHWFQM